MVNALALSYKEKQELKIKTIPHRHNDDEIQHGWFTRYGPQDAMQFAILHKIGALTWPMWEVRLIYRSVTLTRLQFKEYRDAYLKHKDYLEKIMPKRPDWILKLSVAKTWEGNNLRYDRR